jgi:hypothetical protein
MVNLYKSIVYLIVNEFNQFYSKRIGESIQFLSYNQLPKFDSIILQYLNKINPVWKT